MHDNTGVDDFVARWSEVYEDNAWITVTYAVIGLTNFGEKPIPSARLAEVLGTTPSEAEALARQWGWPGTRVEDGLISVDPERARPATRRRAQVGDRRFGVTGCAGDVLLWAPLVRPSVHLEETCQASGAPIQIELAVDRVERVEPDGVVLPIPPAQSMEQTEGMHIEEIDADLCVQAPFYASAEAARGWLAANPGGRVFPIREAWDLSCFRDWRARMSGLLGLR